MKSTPQHKLSEDVTCRPLTRRNWPDLEQLFGPRGASAGCWCMWWRLKRSEWEKQKGEKNRSSFEKIVASGAPTGVLAYLEKQPVGWCAIAPRTHYPVLERSRILSPIDDQPVWSVTCFFIARPHRQSGLTAALLRRQLNMRSRRAPRLWRATRLIPAAAACPKPSPGQDSLPLSAKRDSKRWREDRPGGRL